MTTPRATDAFVVGAVKLLTSALVLARGFRAVSDDDYARIAIAQRFAEAPSLDPSGTSWLPLPFWVYGGAFSLFGGGLEVARVTALLLSVVSTLLVLVAAHWLGANRTGALVAAIVASVFPWSAWLGAAALPEAPVAGLLALGMAALSTRDVRRSLGAGAVGLACFSRYEAWPVAAVFCVLSLMDARRSRSRPLAVAAFVAVLPIALWLAHGAVRHDDSLFFWRRVASYKEALGDQSSPALRAFEPLFELFSEQMGIVVLAIGLVVVRARSGVEPLAPYARGLTCCFALVAFLMVGAATGGTPTHHAARALLPAWFFSTIVLGHAAGSLSVRPRETKSRFAWSGMWLAAVVLFALLFPWIILKLPPDFAHRELELHIGDRARSLGAPALLVDSVDYGYLAVTAASRLTRASTPLDDHDPRKGRPSNPFESAETLRARLDRDASAWLVATHAHAALATKLGTVRARNAGFTLVEPRRADGASPPSIR